VEKKKRKPKENNTKVRGSFVRTFFAYRGKKEKVTKRKQYKGAL
jgi:hypothetical protein